MINLLPFTKKDWVLIKYNKSYKLHLKYC